MCFSALCFGPGNNISPTLLLWFITTNFIYTFIVDNVKMNGVQMDKNIRNHKSFLNSTVYYIYTSPDVRFLSVDGQCSVLHDDNELYE